MAETVEDGRAAFDAGRWIDAFAGLRSATAPADVERLAIVAYLLGREDVADDAWDRAHRGYVAAGEHEPAARCVAWLALLLLLRGEAVRASGWIARGERLADPSHSCTAVGLLQVSRFLFALAAGDLDAVGAISSDIEAIGRACDDADVQALGALCRGEAAVHRHDTGAGMPLLDEAMLLATGGSLGPITTGLIYCAVIDNAMRVLDIARAGHWTDELRRWTERQPGLVPFTGACHVHRCQIMTAEGRWSDAADEAQRACVRLGEAGHPAYGMACYERGELHRLRGEIDASDAAFRSAAAHGYEPVPGLALLMAATGDVTGARATIRRMLAEPGDPLRRPLTLAAAVELFLAAGDVDGAVDACAELEALVDASCPPLARAIADHAAGLLALATGDAETALARLRAARGAWLTLSMPYHDARTGVQLALACRALGDESGCQRELSAAIDTFDRLGATYDARLAAARASGQERGVLTERERSVLHEIAAGHTNRQIAATLTISPHTVARHVQNIFAKLGVSTRAAAVARGIEQHLV